jgi:serine/threonine protein kinase
VNNEKQRSEQAGEIFCNALEIDSASDRDAYVEQACAGSETLRTAVAELLEAHVEAEALFQSGCPTQLSAEELTRSLANEPAFREATRVVVSEERELGQCIGPYRLIRKIGEGGGGNVYLAEQEHPVRRQVALKVLRLGTDTKRVIERFQAERQVLAIMEHPNIAHVLDAGETGEGLPYFVMELVHGTRITDYCDEQGLNIRQREVLFLQVCHAIQHAHQKGIIHRDIKPSNILITMHDDVPVPKVIDFGVAKAMGEEPIDDARVETVCEQFVGTPAYMSPEQAGLGGADVDMRSDIYSLGVTLFHLVVGRLPFESSDDREVLRMQVMESLSSPELKSRGLSHHLHYFIEKMMAKDLEARYQSWDELTEDVRAQIEGRDSLDFEKEVRARSGRRR